MIEHPQDAAELAAVARENGDDELADWLQAHVARERELPEWIQREARSVIAMRRRRTLRHWLIVAALGAAILALLAWALVGSVELLGGAVEGPQPAWHDRAFDEPVAP